MQQTMNNKCLSCGKDSEGHKFCSREHLTAWRTIHGENAYAKMYE